MSAWIALAWFLFGLVAGALGIVLWFMASLGVFNRRRKFVPPAAAVRSH